MIIALVNQKGGVAKTTSTICLGGILAETVPCLLIDLDPQGNLTTGLGIKSEEELLTIDEVLRGEAEALEAVCKTKFEQLDLIPADVMLAQAERMLASGKKYKLLKEKLTPLQTQYPCILIDCPPSLGMLTANALGCADAVLIPVQCQFFALKGLTSLLNTIQLVRKQLNPNLKILGIIPTMAENTIMCRDVFDSLCKEMKNVTTVFKPVPKSVKFPESNLAGEPIHIYADKEPKLAASYQQIVQQILTNR